MQVLCVTQNFPPTRGGIAVFLHNLCAQLCHLGYQVDVLTPVREGCAEADAGQPYCVYRYVSPQRLSSIVPIRCTLTLHRQHHYDVVLIGHFMTTHALGVLVLRRLWGTPYVVLCHGNDLHYSISHWMDRPAAYLLSHKASLKLCNSHATAERVRRKNSQGSIALLHPGVDPDEFRPGLETSSLVQRYNLAGKKVLLSVSRLVERKGHAQVLHALPEVIKTVPDILYLIVGEGEEEVRLRKMVKDLGIGPYVVFTGHVKQTILPVLYCACDLFVMPSFSRDGDQDYEGFGIVFAEANACGLPVIGGRSGGIADAVMDGKTGMLVDPHDVDAITEAIIRLLTDRELAQRLSDNGRRWVERELSWEKVAKRLSALLQAVVDGRVETGDDWS